MFKLICISIIYYIFNNSYYDCYNINKQFQIENSKDYNKGISLLNYFKGLKTTNCICMVIEEKFFKKIKKQYPNSAIIETISAEYFKEILSELEDFDVEHDVLSVEVDLNNDGQYSIYEVLLQLGANHCLTCVSFLDQYFYHKTTGYSNQIKLRNFIQDIEGVDLLPEHQNQQKMDQTNSQIYKKFSYEYQDSQQQKQFIDGSQESNHNYTMQKYIDKKIGELSIDFDYQQLLNVYGILGCGLCSFNQFEDNIDIQNECKQCDSIMKDFRQQDNDSFELEIPDVDNNSIEIIQTYKFIDFHEFETNMKAVNQCPLKTNSAFVQNLSDCPRGCYNYELQSQLSLRENQQQNTNFSQLCQKPRCRVKLNESNEQMIQTGFEIQDYFETLLQIRRDFSSRKNYLEREGGGTDQFHLQRDSTKAFYEQVYTSKVVDQLAYKLMPYFNLLIGEKRLLINQDSVFNWQLPVHSQYYHNFKPFGLVRIPPEYTNPKNTRSIKCTDPDSNLCPCIPDAATGATCPTNTEQAQQKFINKSHTEFNWEFLDFEKMQEMTHCRSNNDQDQTCFYTQEMFIPQAPDDSFTFRCSKDDCDLDYCILCLAEKTMYKENQEYPQDKKCFPKPNAPINQTKWISFVHPEFDKCKDLCMTQTQELEEIKKDYQYVMSESRFLYKLKIYQKQYKDKLGFQQDANKVTLVYGNYRNINQDLDLNGFQCKDYYKNLSYYNFNKQQYQGIANKYNIIFIRIGFCKYKKCFQKSDVKKQAENIKIGGVKSQRSSCEREFNPIFPEDISNKCNFGFNVNYQVKISKEHEWKTDSQRLKDDNYIMKTFYPNKFGDEQNSKDENLVGIETFQINWETKKVIINDSNLPEFEFGTQAASGEIKIGKVDYENQNQVCREYYMCDGENYYIFTDRTQTQDVQRPPLMDDYFIMGSPENLSKVQHNFDRLRRYDFYGEFQSKIKMIDNKILGLESQLSRLNYQNNNFESIQHSESNQQVDSVKCKRILSEYYTREDDIQFHEQFEDPVINKLIGGKKWSYFNNDEKRDLLNRMFGYWDKDDVHTMDSIDNVQSICGQIMYKFQNKSSEDYEYILKNFRQQEFCEKLAAIQVGRIGAAKDKRDFKSEVVVQNGKWAYEYKARFNPTICMHKQYCEKNFCKDAKCCPVINQVDAKFKAVADVERVQDLNQWKLKNQNIEERSELKQQQQQSLRFLKDKFLAIFRQENESTQQNVFELMSVKIVAQIRNEIKVQCCSMCISCINHELLSSVQSSNFELCLGQSLTDQDFEDQPVFQTPILGEKIVNRQLLTHEDKLKEECGNLYKSKF